MTRDSNSISTIRTDLTHIQITHHISHPVWEIEAIPAYHYTLLRTDSVKIYSKSHKNLHLSNYEHFSHFHSISWTACENNVLLLRTPYPLLVLVMCYFYVVCTIHIHMYSHIYPDIYSQNGAGNTVSYHAKMRRYTEQIEQPNVIECFFRFIDQKYPLLVTRG